MKQLFLFTSAQEDTRRLREEYDILAAWYRDLEAQYTHVETRLEHAKEEFRKLREDRDQAQWERDQARRTLAAAETMRDFYKDLAMFGARTATPAPTLEPTLKKLVTLCHPDKWSAGQLATALAHELTVVLK